MSRRRAQQSPGSASVLVQDMPISARVAWAYLGSVLAAAGAGLGALMASQSVNRLVCANASGEGALTCRVGAWIWSAVVCFVIFLLPAFRMLKLDWWLWLTMVAGAGLLVAVDQVTEWWWWLLAALLPAAAALLSADWERGARFRAWQQRGLVALVGLAIAGLVWWFVRY